jgi:hypothetical protein
MDDRLEGLNGGPLVLSAFYAAPSPPPSAAHWTLPLAPRLLRVSGAWSAADTCRAVAGTCSPCAVSSCSGALLDGVSFRAGAASARAQARCEPSAHDGDI